MKNQAKMAYQSLWNEYMNMPPVTRAYTTACVLTTLVVVSVYILYMCDNILFNGRFIVTVRLYILELHSKDYGIHMSMNIY